MPRSSPAPLPSAPSSFSRHAATPPTDAAMQSSPFAFTRDARQLEMLLRRVRQFACRHAVGMRKAAAPHARPQDIFCQTRSAPRARCRETSTIFCRASNVVRRRLPRAQRSTQHNPTAQCFTAVKGVRHGSKATNANVFARRTHAAKPITLPMHADACRRQFSASRRP